MNKEGFLVVLAEMCDVSDDIMRQATARILTFTRGRARVTIRILFEDEQSGADILFTNMTTLPDEERNLGNGSICLSSVINCAKRFGFENIQATQVQAQSEEFWRASGFSKLNNVTNDFRYTRI